MEVVKDIAVDAAKEVFAFTQMGQAYGFVFKHTEPEMYNNIQDYVIQAEASGSNREDIALAVAAYVYYCLRVNTLE
jgi:hypothetical protein